jgi:hypothetical protein
MSAFPPFGPIQVVAPASDIGQKTLSRPAIMTPLAVDGNILMVVGWIVVIFADLVEVDSSSFWMCDDVNEASVP